MAAKSIKLILVLSLVVLLMFTASAAIKTFTVEETNFVKITPEAVDLDGDEITYEYSEPLDEQGEWQTGYDDAGNYEIEIIASDGVEETVEKVNLVVENKNQAPVITEKKIVAKETQLVDLKSIISDPDEDALSYTFNAPFDDSGLWQTEYEDSGNSVAIFTVSDGHFNVEARVEIEILATNQPPTITETFSSQTTLDVNEGEELSFFVTAKDNDNDKITYQWKLDQDTIVQEESGEHYFGFSSSGKHTLEVIVNDGDALTIKEWTINVENTNRPPKISHLPVTVKEGEEVVLDLPSTDEDDEELSYSIDAPFNQNGEWQTDFDDAGEYEIEVTASDGELESKTTVEVTVLNVDRKPTINFPETLEINEGEVKEWDFTALDPDGDKITISLNKNVADLNFDLEEDVITWQPSYLTIQRSGGFFSEVLNYFRLEHHFLKSKKDTIEVKVCGAKLCETQEMDLIVYNVNRAPVLDDIEKITFVETEKVKLDISAVDPDGDLIRYYFSNPLGKKNGEWQTDFDDRGTYTTYVTATDGKNSATKAIQVEVLKNNRAPTLDINKDEYVINEKEAISFQVEVSDPDSENLSIMLEYLPPGASFNAGTFSWEPDYDVVNNKTESWWNNFVSNNDYLNRKYNVDEETIWLSFVGSDESFDVIHPVKLTIKNKNRKPEIIDFLPEEEITVGVKQPIIFHVAAKDADNEKLSYTWKFGLNQDLVKGTDTVERTFLTAGTKKVKVIVSDGNEEVEKVWIVKVESTKQIYTEKIEKVTHLVPMQPVNVRTYVIDVPPEKEVVPEPQKDNDYSLGVYYIENGKVHQETHQNGYAPQDNYDLDAYYVEG